MYKIEKRLKNLKNLQPGFYNPFREDNYIWRELLDENDSILPTEEIARKLPDQNVYFDMWYTDYEHECRRISANIQNSFEVNRRFITAINKLTKIALQDKKNKYEFSDFIKNLVFYRLEKGRYRDILEALLVRKHDEVRLGRFDVLSNGKVSEFQLASGGWSSMIRLNQIKDGSQKSAKLMYSVFQQATNLDSPKILFLVTKGVAQYWHDLADFSLALNQAVGADIAFVSGAEGLSLDAEGLYYIRNNQERVKVDMVYSIGDIRRLVNEGAGLVLEALLQRDISFQPTVNPLLNNYQLALSLLNEPLTAKWLKYELGIEEYDRLLDYYVRYYLVHDACEVPIKLNHKRFFLNVVYWMKNMSSSQRREHVLRKVLSSDDKGLSGGWGVRKFSNYKTKRDRNTIIDISNMYYHALKESAVFVEPYKDLYALANFYDSTLKKDMAVYKYLDGKVIKREIKEPLTLYQYFVVNKTGKFEIMGKHAFYSDRDESHMHIGSSTRTIGYLN